MLVVNVNIATNKHLYKRMGDMSWYSSYEKKLAALSFGLLFGFYILSIWTPLKMGTPWFFIGAILFILGFLGSSIARHNYVTTPENKPITKGMYKVSRNPLYLCNGLMFSGMVVASLSIFCLIVLLGLLINTHLIILAEERYCLKTYGDSYQEYMQKVSRYFLFF